MSPMLQAIFDEATRAASNYGPPTSTQESLGVLLEEFDELKEAIHANNRTQICREAIQVAAVSYRLAVECTNGNVAFARRSGLAFDEDEQEAA